LNQWGLTSCRLEYFRFRTSPWRIFNWRTTLLSSNLGQNKRLLGDNNEYFNFSSHFSLEIVFDHGRNSLFGIIFCRGSILRIAKCSCVNCWIEWSFQKRLRCFSGRFQFQQIKFACPTKGRELKLTKTGLTMGSKSYKITYVKTERQQYSDWIQNWTCKSLLSPSNYNLEFILILALTKFNQSRYLSDSEHLFS